MSNKAPKCQLCDQKASIKGLCHLCNSMIKNIKKKSWNKEIPEDINQKSIEIIGGGEQSSPKRWKSFEASVSELDLINWAKLEKNQDPVLEFPCDKEKGLAICSELEGGARLNAEDRSILHCGFQMINNTRISFLSSKVVVNGRVLPNDVPVASIVRMIYDEKARIGWDISQLVIALGSINIPTGGNINERYNFRVRQRRRHVDRDSVLATLSWIEWMAEENIAPPENYRLHPLSVWARDLRLRLTEQSGIGFQETVNIAFHNHPGGMEHISQYPWIGEWKNYNSPTIYNTPGSWPLSIFSMNLKIKVRNKQHSTRLASVPNRPCIWAAIIALAFSPASSKNGHLLYSIQYNWTHQKENVVDIPPPLQRSIQLLYEVINGNSAEVFIEQDTILVIGRLGHFYEVKVGEGAHGAPYIIRLVSSLKPRKSKPICIHSGRFHSNLPLGDTIASVVLALLDDVSISQRVESLRSELSNIQPIGFPSLLSEQHIQLLDNNALKEFTKNLAGQTPRWLSREQLEWDLIEEEGFGPAERVRQQFNYIMRRNRYYVELKENKAIEEDGSKKVIAEDLEKNNSKVSISKLVKIWRKEFKPIMDSDNPQVFERFWNHFHGRRDWIYLRNNGRPENEHPIGDIRDGERRYCEVIPRVWEALMLQPVGSHVTLSTVNNGEISFQHCQLKVTIRNQAERNFLKRLLAMLGYDEDEGDQLERQQVYYRRDHPRPGIRRRLTNLLTRFQSRMGARGAPPWWWHYADVAQPPNEVPEFRWQLQEDLTDNR